MINHPRTYRRFVEDYYGQGITHPQDRYYLDGVGYLIGDISCRFNARSGQIRCAVNPIGSCQNCRHFDTLRTKVTEILLTGNSLGNTFYSSLRPSNAVY